MTSRYAILHMENESIEVVASVPTIEKEYPDLFF